MKTVKQLIRELEKFPEDALCYVYEGEVTGIIVNHKDIEEAVIYCSAYDDETPSELMSDDLRA